MENTSDHMQYGGFTSIAFCYIDVWAWSSAGEELFGIIGKGLNVSTDLTLKSIVLNGWSVCHLLPVLLLIISRLCLLSVIPSVPCFRRTSWWHEKKSVSNVLACNLHTLRLAFPSDHNWKIGKKTGSWFPLWHFFDQYGSLGFHQS